MTDSIWNAETGHLVRCPEQSNIRAYYQPILAMDTHRIAGYEALGREQLDSGVSSLGPFLPVNSCQRKRKSESIELCGNKQLLHLPEKSVLKCFF